MTKDDIIEMLGWPKGDHHDSSDLLRRIMDVVAAEREACAAMLDDRATLYTKDGIVGHIVASCAAAIRARGAAPKDKS